MSKILGDLEQSVMDIIWNSSEALKPADVQMKLDKELAYTTVMTIMKRLADKGLLKRERIQNVFYYSPLKSRDSFAKQKLKSLYTNLVGSYGELAVSQFIDTIKEDPESMDLLKKFLEKQK